MRASFAVWVAALLLKLQLAAADFSPEFNKFLVDTYGQGIDNLLARRDLGPDSSYGGGAHDGRTRTKKQAVILVHGITNTASTFQGHRQHLLKVGWNEDNVFATTWGDGGKTPMPMVDMKCEYVRQVRYLIQVVAAFTKRKVDVIAYSMGSPISRKAILGGACVDTGENLGPPLTGLIDTFVSVAGANRGSFLCLFPLPGACNMVNGMSCNSRFIQDINSRQHYEGRFVFTIYSPGDDKVGHRNACGQFTAQIDGANNQIEKGGNHDDVIWKTAQLQFNLIDKQQALGQ